MQQAASAYSKVAQATQSPRELEAAILMKAVTRLQTIRELERETARSFRGADL